MLPQVKQRPSEAHQFLKGEANRKVKSCALNSGFSFGLMFVVAFTLCLFILRAWFFLKRWFSKDADLVQPYLPLTSGQLRKLFQNRHPHSWRRPKSKLSAALRMSEAGPGCEWNHQPLPLEFAVQLALLGVLHKQLKLDLVGVKVKE